MRDSTQLKEIGEGVHAYLQQGGWGYSNAGLIVNGGASLLVDTLYDLKLTGRMLQQMRRIVPGTERIGTVVNTHANGDHCWGNQLVSDAEIISSQAAADEMLELPPALMLALLRAAKGISRLGPAARVLERLGKLGVPRVGELAQGADFLQECFGDFDFRGIRLTPPTRTFRGELELRVGDKRVRLLELGPAHTKGDVIAYLPDDRIVFTGDILFVDSHPIVWEGPVRNWVRACEALLSLDVDVVVPGHGPLTTKSGVQDTKDYWTRIEAAAKEGYATGASADEVARQLLAEGMGDWGEPHRLVVNVDTIYRELAGEQEPRDPLALFARMARLEQAG